MAAHPAAQDYNGPSKRPKVMQTVDKALGLLHYFTLSKPEFGLSELARTAGLDKATTLRCLAALERHGFVEQHPESKKYRLGFSLLQLARIREVSFPVTALIRPIVDHLADLTGETAHASLLSGNDLVNIVIAEPQRAIRVSLDPSELLPLHASASGNVMLAFADQDKLARIGLSDQLEAYTDNTVTSRDQLEGHLTEIRAKGYAITDQTFEPDVTGTAAPVFDWAGKAVGAVAVAAISSRYTGTAAERIRREVVSAAAEITRQLGGNEATSLQATGS